ncbi:hypothetical protein [Streptomyces sp. ISL-86]|uniref:hypothetical protein n=1 Tax=Streptomyces sp. ISL-86 TaxID=2819187 RepID=UPI001BE50752|nr:hypothetical protein [Streptomyces sp. ISL-86]MBT2456627.1 hypothetical protein [Streptomyces sp. ISL-86]
MRTVSPSAQLGCNYLLCIPPQNGVLEQLPAAGTGAEQPGCVREVMLTGAAGQEFHGGVKSGLFLAGYVVDGDTEEDVAANLERVAGWFSDNTRWRPADSSGGTA